MSITIQATDKLPWSGRGRQSAEANARYLAAVEKFAAVILEIVSGLGFRPSSESAERVGQAGYLHVLRNGGPTWTPWRRSLRRLANMEESR